MEKGSLFTGSEKTEYKKAYLSIIKEEQEPTPEDEMGPGAETSEEPGIEPEAPIMDNPEGEDNELKDIGVEMDKKNKAYIDKLKSSLDKNDEERVKVLNKASEEIVRLLSAKKLNKKEIVGILREVIRELE